MYHDCLGCDSVDDAGLVLTSTVHYEQGYANAFWNGAQMVFGDSDSDGDGHGDGDGKIFGVTPVRSTSPATS